ncbi:MAG TPA: hypothetical protein VGC21_16590 [Telluria sp.]
MDFVFYRGDNRVPEVIKRDGFDFFNDAKVEVDRAGTIYNYLNLNILNKFETFEDFRQWVIVGKNRARPTISTALNADCGGYGSGFIYTIKFEKSLTKSSRRSQKGDFEYVIYADQENLQQAGIIGFSVSPGTVSEEVAFFTKIGQANIVNVRDAKNNTSRDMADIQTATPAGPGKLVMPAAFGR